ncbi:hypothetical protein BDQ17DRAFT_1261203, partial [Cyathus striatus]
PPSPPLIPDDRLNQGIQHNLLGYYLCPITLDWNDIVIRNKIRAGNDPDYTIGSTYFCHFLYHKFEGDVFDLEDGFLRSHMLVKAFCHIFTSPGLARGIQLDQENDSDIGSTTSRPCYRRPHTHHDVATLLHMKAVMPRSIAYVCTQVHFVLSSTPSWTMEYEGFHYGDFYHFIVDYFEAVSGKQAKEWVRALLTWWNWYVSMGSLPNPANFWIRKIFPQSVAAAPPMNALTTSLDRLHVARRRRE